MSATTAGSVLAITRNWGWSIALIHFVKLLWHHSIIFTRFAFVITKPSTLESFGILKVISIFGFTTIEAATL
jgi:hypothetical protein